MPARPGGFVFRQPDATVAVARDNIDALTGLRFVAALMIVVGHSYTPALETTAIGMPLFFTLSGFIIHYVYSDAFSQGWRRATGEFAVARFSRLYPLYFVLLAYLILRSPGGHSFGHIQNFPALLAYLLMCWTWWPFEIDGHGAGFFYISWSVSTEIFFYICYALFLYRIIAIRNIRSCLFILIAFCILAYVLFFTLFATRDIWEPMALANHPEYVARVDNYNLSFYRWLLYISPYCRLPEFIGGVLTCQLFLLSRQHPSRIGRVSPALVGTVAIAVMAVLYVQFRYFGETDPWYAIGHFTYGAFIVNLHQNFLFAPCCYALIFSLACGGWRLSRLLASRPAGFLGDISYSTYLSHPLVIDKVERMGLQFTPVALYLLVLFAVIYALSWVLYSLIEMPAKRLLRTIVYNWTLRRAAMATSNSV
jgi:peptidoglycan/LPS O-acetylase OafA/YrhL